MKTTVNKSDFRDAFHQMGRDNQFSYEALGLLFDYLEELEDSTGEELELDVIGICCDYVEASYADVVDMYSELQDLVADAAPEDVPEIVDTFIEGHTTFVGRTDVGIVFADF